MSMRHLVEARQQDENTDADAPQKQSSSDTSKFLRSWAWKREHRPDKTRFHRPYIHFMTSPAVKLTLQQSKFDAEGFASTIWDSSIVMSKYFERWDGRWVGKKCLDLSAGCGLVGIVLARLGADVVLTDLLPNLPLLADNCKANVPEDASGSVIVKEHRWGERLADLGGPFDVIVACDVMYIEAAIPDLVKTLPCTHKQPVTPVIVVEFRHGHVRLPESFADDPSGDSSVALAGGSIYRQHTCRGPSKHSQITKEFVTYEPAVSATHC
ncbi:hypothetical protein WJX79_007925 [Trebouxia sp. C0005]